MVIMQKGYSVQLALIILALQTRIQILTKGHIPVIIITISDSCYTNAKTSTIISLYFDLLMPG